jgi:hypothetical protein
MLATHTHTQQHQQHALSIIILCFATALACAPAWRHGHACAWRRVCCTSCHGVCGRAWLSARA